jgi:Malectin domain
MNFRILSAFGAVLGAMSLAGQASATSAAPSKYPAPYTCLRNFFVSVGGSSASNCGSSGTPCGSIQNANDASNIGGTGGPLTGGDCVNVAAGTYNTTGTIVLSRSGTNAAQNAQGLLTGYIAYIGAPNHGSIINYTQDTGGAGINPTGNYTALDGFDLNGNSLLGTSIYGQGGSHHHWVLNNLAHDSGGGGIGFGGGGDYFFAYHNEVYNTSWSAPNAQSGMGVFEPIGADQTPLGFTTLPADTQTFHIQFVGNVMHENSCNQAAVGLAGGHDCGTHTDGNGIILDDFSNYQRSGCNNPTNTCRYLFNSLVEGNVAYHNGGRGIYALGGAYMTFINNIGYDNCHDLGAGCGDITYIACHSCTWDNNIAWTTFSGSNAIVFNASGAEDDGNVFTNNLSFDGTPGHLAYTVDPAYAAAFPGNNPLLGKDPKLANAPAQDFHLLPGSPALGAGAIIAGLPGPISTPDGQNQPSPPNIGAFTTGTVPSVHGPVSISAGGPAATPFIADAGFTGGLTITHNPSGAVDTSLVTNPAPVSVYRSERYGTFTYTVSNLTANKSYTVNLHFTEDYWTAAGQRLFNVSINGSRVPSSFDIFAATGAQHKAIVKTFTAVADVNGKVAISFAPTTSSPDQNAKVDGVEVLAISSPTAKLTSNPTSVTSGQNSTLTWSSTNATSCTGTGFSTGNAVSWSVGVSPTASTTYTVSCANGGTRATANTTVKVTAPPSTPVEDFQYVAGSWYLPDFVLPASGNPGANQANTIRCSPAGMRNKATINNVASRVYTADAAGHLKFAIYTNGSNNRPATLVATSGSMSTTPAGNVISSALNASVQGGPGGANFSDKFWFCANSDSATATFASVNSTGGLTPNVLGTTTSANVLQASGSGALVSHLSCTGSACNGGSSTYANGFPASLAGTTWTEQTVIRMPMMAIQFSAVP